MLIRQMCICKKNLEFVNSIRFFATIPAYFCQSIKYCQKWRKNVTTTLYVVRYRILRTANRYQSARGCDDRKRLSVARYSARWERKIALFPLGTVQRTTPFVPTPKTDSLSSDVRARKHPVHTGTCSIESSLFDTFIHLHCDDW